MMTKLNPYIIFNGNCREAMNFYQQCIGGQLSLQTVEDSPMADQWPAEAQHYILHATLTKAALVLLASDMGGKDLVHGNNVFLSLTCTSRNEIDAFFKNLSAGGQVTRPLHDFFAGMIGALTDKYGISWLLYL